jgi:hypothetical protein
MSILISTRGGHREKEQESMGNISGIGGVAVGCAFMWKKQ